MTTSKPRVEEGGMSQLLFDLSSPDRLALLNSVATGRRRMSALAKLIDSSQPECSRHLARLTEAGLIRRDGEGLYGATTFGMTILTLLPAIRMATDNKQYFLSHDISFLPGGFLERIGALSAGSYVDHISSVLEHIKKVVSEARGQVWMISDKLFPQWPGIGQTFSSNDLPIRLISAQSIDPKVLKEYKSRFSRSEIATLKDVRIAMVINETTAGVCFPSQNGTIDWGSGFAGSDPAFRGWCADLFDTYWSRASKAYALSPFS